MNDVDPTFYNPYIAGPPITNPSMFFGRQADLDKIVNLLRGGNFVMLIGPRRIGKTSLLHQLKTRLAGLENGVERFVPVLVSVEGTHQAEFFHAVMEDIINLTAERLPPNLVGKLSFDLAISNYSARLFARDLQIILSNLQATLPKPCHLTLLLDEMDTFNNYDLATQAQLRRIFQRFTHHNLSVVAAGVNLQQQWAGESSPFFNMFVPVTLTPFDAAEARRLITEPVAGVYRYRDEAINRILEATGGLPHRIQQLCLETIYYLPSAAKQQPEITAKLINKALAEIAWLDEDVEMKDEARRVTEFMSTVSHELRTPITSIKGYIDLLRTGAVGPLTDKQKQFLDVISTNIERMTVLINDLLYVSRIDTGRLHLNMQEVNAVDLINEVAAKFQTEIENNRLSLKIEIADHLPQLHIDYQRIDQVLTNLMSNACKYTAPGGEITMSATPCYDEVSGMCLTVKDTGYGIAKEDQARLFTRFFRSHDQQVRSTHGTGLGLAISKTIVEAHRGKLTVDSELGKGSAFTVFLPL